MTGEQQIGEGVDGLGRAGDGAVDAFGSKDQRALDGVAAAEFGEHRLDGLGVGEIREFVDRHDLEGGSRWGGWGHGIWRSVHCLGSSIVRQRGQSEKSWALGLEVFEEFAGGGAAGTIGANGGGRGAVADEVNARIAGDLGGEAASHGDAAGGLTDL